MTLPDGRVIQHSVAAHTFVDVIWELGVEDVQKLDLRLNGVPLVDTKKHDKYSQIQKGKYYIATFSSTKAKKKRLEQIGKSLGKTLRIEIVPAEGMH